MLSDIYNQMLDDFGESLKQTSIDTDETPSHIRKERFMTTCQEYVVNFDKFKESIVSKFKLSRSPNSCDALYMHNENEWFLIEFKNGKIDREKMYQVRGKVFQSLLILTEKLNNTISFTRSNINFILVYNEDIEYTARHQISMALSKLAGNNHYIFFGIDGLNLYFKDVFTWNRKEFQDKFVSIYFLD
ncbi:MAG: hypothetical protein LBI40_03515 [Treponema sp.]|jgi:hypothetical protein|nr:hypothetical protein [Treponema sp.]